MNVYYGLIVVGILPIYKRGNPVCCLFIGDRVRPIDAPDTMIGDPDTLPLVCVIIEPIAVQLLSVEDLIINPSSRRAP